MRGRTRKCTFIRWLLLGHVRHIRPNEGNKSKCSSKVCTRLRKDNRLNDTCSSRIVPFEICRESRRCNSTFHSSRCPSTIQSVRTKVWALAVRQACRSRQRKAHTDKSFCGRGELSAVAKRHTFFRARACLSGP